MINDRDTLTSSITYGIAYQTFNRPYLDLLWSNGFPFLSPQKHPSTEHLNNKTYFKAYNKILSQTEYITWTQIYVGVMNQITNIHN